MLSRAQAFCTLGYRSALFRDDDKRPPKAKETEFQRDGGCVFTWRDGKKIEVEIFDSIPPDAVGPLLEIALEEREKQSINDQLKTVSENKVTLATVLAEVEASELSHASRHALGEASGKGWFKNISTMERVARDVIAPRATKLDKEFLESINTIRKWCLNVR